MPRVVFKLIFAARNLIPYESYFHLAIFRAKFENHLQKKKGSSEVTVDENFKLTLPIGEPGRCPSQARL